MSVARARVYWFVCVCAYLEDLEAFVDDGQAQPQEHVLLHASVAV